MIVNFTQIILTATLTTTIFTFISLIRSTKALTKAKSELEKARIIRDKVEQLVKEVEYLKLKLM
jgi:hypothetical protein